jgi:hypothetical protein
VEFLLNLYKLQFMCTVLPRLDLVWLECISYSIDICCSSGLHIQSNPVRPPAELLAKLCTAVMATYKTEGPYVSAILLLWCCRIHGLPCIHSRTPRVLHLFALPPHDT